MRRPDVLKPPELGQVPKKADIKIQAEHFYQKY